MNRARFVPVLIAAAILAACSKEPGKSSGTSAAAPGTRYALPALLTYAGDKAGQLARINFRFDRSAARDKPFACALIEELPGASGESLRLSLNLAAAVAALERNDDLSGVEIFVEIPGKVEGPSMGALLTLAILSALDGKQLPGDFAMTGSILPDGAVGPVFDIVHKIEAAKAAGVKRVLIPGSIRFDKDPATGQETDVKKRAAELGIELVPVDTIAKAYLAVHNLQPPADSAPANSASLPAEAENFFKKQYDSNQKAGDAIWNAFTDVQRDAINKEPLLRENLVDLPARARTAQRSGRFVYAAESMRRWAAMLQAQKETEDFFATLKGQDLEGVANDVVASNNMRDQTYNTLVEESALIADIQKSSTIVGAQFCAEILDERRFRTNFGLYQEKVAALVAAVRATADPAKRLESFRQILVVQKPQLFCQKASLSLPQSAAANAKSLSALTTPLTPQVDPQRMYRLLYGSFYSTQRRFFEFIARPNMIALKTTEDGAIAVLAQRDPFLATYIEGNQRLQRIYSSIRDTTPDNFTYAAASHACVGGIASMNALIERWSTFGPNTFPTITFRRTDLISDLLTHARETSLAAIAQCKARSIPAYQALYYFEAAEIGRDDSAEDKASVLCNYWKASLQAKLLLALYAPRK